jgi:cyclohexanecarboxylate-CoA ligase
VARTRALSSTFRHFRAGEYLRPGGPWDVPDLDAGLRGTGLRLVHGERRLDPAALEAAVGDTAGWLAAAGVGPRSVVAWQFANGLEPYLLYRACWRLGAVAVPLHHAAGVADVERSLAQVEPDLIIAGPSFPAGGRPGAVTVEPGEWPAPSSDAVAPPEIDPGDPAVVLFTSGSSGTPKAVVHTHRGLLAKARIMTSVHGLGPEDVVLMPAPLAHISGLLNAVLVAGAAGMGVVLMARWDPVAAVGLIRAEQVSFMVGPPTFFVGLMGAEGCDAGAVASLRLISSGGSGVTPAFVEAARETLGCRVKRTYGSTEAPTMTTSWLEDGPDRERDTDGRPTPHVELRITEPSAGSEVGAGTEGEVWVRGPEVCEGYLDPAATEEAFTPDGWFRTGDLGRVDPDGWLTITGRIKDVIIRGGENISAAEVEAALEAHPLVTQAVAVGYPDERLGQRVCAVVVADGTFDLGMCQAWMAERGVTRFKWPERVEQVATLPVLGSGKVDRAAVARRLTP